MQQYLRPKQKATNCLVITVINEYYASHNPKQYRTLGFHSQVVLTKFSFQPQATNVSPTIFFIGLM